MTISSSIAKAVYLTNPAVSEYACPFKIFDASQISVIVADKGTRAETALSLGRDYSVAGLGSDAGGAVTLTAAGIARAGTGNSLVLLRSMAFIQEVDYRPHDVFPAETHERALDILTMECQELREQVERAVKVVVSEAGPPPSAQDLYNQVNSIADRAEDAVTRAEDARAEAETASDAAVEAAAEAVSRAGELQNLSIAVGPAPEGEVASGDYDAKTGMLTLRVPEGPTGPRGEKGEPGINGVNGADGRPGDQGPPGPPAEIPDALLPVTLGYFFVNEAGLLMFAYNGSPVLGDLSINAETGELEVSYAQL